jgi:hypothetical protein
MKTILCGYLCIVTYLAGNQELLRDEVNGFLVEPPMGNCRRSDEKRLGESGLVDTRALCGGNRGTPMGFKDPAEDFVRELLALVDYANAR